MEKWKVLGKRNRRKGYSIRKNFVGRLAAVYRVLRMRKRWRDGFESWDENSTDKDNDWIAAWKLNEI